MAVLVIAFILISYMLFNDKKYHNELVKTITENTDISVVDYINKYDNYYIVLDHKYLYLIDSNFVEILEIDRELLNENSYGYDIIYKDDKLMYFHDYYKDKKLVYEYYDIYTYELIDRVFVGGN